MAARSLVIVLLLVPISALTRQAIHVHGQHEASPYTGQELREIKALSADEIASLRNGEGMGFAKAAELNGYPGPRHVLDLAAGLQLSDSQVEATMSLFEEMHAHAVALGERLIEAERALDRLFAAKEADAATLRQALAEIAKIEGELRFVHLEAHLRQTGTLTAAQIRLYEELRGYRESHGQER